MMSSIEHRIFVVGVSRSGTTLVQSLLASHTALTSFTESHFFDRHFALLPWLSKPILARNPVPGLRDFLAENGIGTAEAAALLTATGLTDSAYHFAPLRTSSAARQFLDLLDRVAMQRSRAGWIEKTPRHLRYIPFLEGLAREESRIDFVHVVRTGVDVVASLHVASRNWERAYDLDTCVKRWNEDLSFALERAPSLNDHFVFYEELTADPERTMGHLFRDLALDWQPEILSRFGDTASELMTAEETWKEDVGRRLRRSAGAERTLTQAQRDRVAAALDSELYDRLQEVTRASADSSIDCRGNP